MYDRASLRSWRRGGRPKSGEFGGVRTLSARGRGAMGTVHGIRGGALCRRACAWAWAATRCDAPVSSDSRVGWLIGEDQVKSDEGA